MQDLHFISYLMVRRYLEQVSDRVLRRLGKR